MAFVLSALAVAPSLTRLSVATEPAYAVDIAVYDRVLAEAKPEQKFVKFGDVGLTRAQLQTFRDRLVAARARPGPNFVTPAGTTFKWPGGNVYYRFDPAQIANNTITPAKMQQFRDSVSEWTAWANVSFVESIAGHPNFITVQEDANLGGGFSSAVGMAGGEQFVRFGPGAWNRGTICHEVGHALGLFHEHQRPDRNTYVAINLSNIAPASQPNFAIIPDGVNHGAYDFFSVMHYARNALALNPNIDTISMQPGFAQFADIIGRVVDRTLSKLDRSGMAEVYGNPTVLPSAAVTNTKDGGAGSLRAAIYYAFDRSTDVPAVPTTVMFQIPTSDPGFAGGVFTIKPTFGLTAPGAGTTIDGASQTAFTGNTNSGGPEVMIDGSQIGAQNLGLFTPGFILREANCAVRNLVINGFNEQGIRLTSTSSTGNVVIGCYIGTNSTGTAAAPNASSGVRMVAGAHGNTIGGDTAGTRNVISGNKFEGIVCADAGTDGNLIIGNYIGTNAAGTGAVGNGFADSVNHLFAPGISINNGAKSNLIGGTSAELRNLISGNAAYGVVIANSGTDNNKVLGNFIGTNASGTAVLGNGFADPPNFFLFAGVGIYGGAKTNTIGGTASGAGNVVSGNGAQGVLIADAGTASNAVQGNLIGTDFSGSVAIGNGYSGVGIFGGAQANTIGGATPGARNVISGNLAQGIALFDLGTNGNFIQGNYIGVNAAGTAALANAFSGVELFRAQATQIGGPAGARNVISGNANFGLLLTGADTSTNLIQGNTIGRNAAGNASMPNAFSGLGIFSGANANVIGGTAPGTSNVISGNGGDGVQISNAGSIRNSILGNSIYNNAGSGIALFTGGNNGQVAPTLATATVSTPANPNGTDISGSLGASATTATRVEIFANPMAGNEGQIFLGALSVPTGMSNFAGSLSAAVPFGYALTATATDANGNTSPFSSTRAITLADADSDGIPDQWTITNFGHATGAAGDLSRANDDADGDGLTNLQEYRAGTNPKAAASFLRITAITRNASDLGITFASVAGKTYRLESASSLTPPDWATLEEQVVATAASTQILDLGVAILPRRFYRVSIEP